MKKLAFATGIFALLLLAFLAGYQFSRQNSTAKDSTGHRKILYYIDPMNPAYKSDKPGFAPGCGMPLEPVYADGRKVPQGMQNNISSMPPGTVQITPEKQQLIGIRTAIVEKAAGSQDLRVSGRVVPDESRIYRMTAGVEGWVKKVYPVTTGMLVKKDQLLATVYAAAYYNAVNALINSLPASVNDRESAINSLWGNINVRDRLNNLRSLGMSDLQIAEIARTRQNNENVELRAPASGLIMARNITPGQQYERGFEFYRIFDISRVWVLADIYENEASFYKPGMRVQVDIPQWKKSVYARVSNALPLYDAASRTLKVRLELDNPGLILRPDMFVDVQISKQFSSILSVPLDALLDSGIKKTVFVDRGNGFFEPRKVETGRYFEDRVEIIRGLVSGERIVVSGSFLIDSESRMRAVAAETHGMPVVDHFCGMNVNQKKAAAAGNISTYQGKTYYFCNSECKLKFDKDPQRFVASQPAGDKSQHDTDGGHHHD